MKSILSYKLILGSGFCILACLASAGTYQVTWDVSALGLPNTQDPSGLMYLDLQLTDGTNTGDGASTATISNLNLSGGSFTSALPDLGNVSTLPDGSILLTDGVGGANAVADHAQGFIVNSSSATLSFDFTTAVSSYDTPPDYFNVSLLLNDESTVLALGPTQTEFLGYQITPDPTVQPQTYGVDPTFASLSANLGDRRFLSLPPPSFQAVPEPSLLPTFAVGLTLIARCRRRRSEPR